MNQRWMILAALLAVSACGEVDGDGTGASDDVADAMAEDLTDDELVADDVDIAGGLLNVNTAADADLRAAGISDAAVAAIAAGRPFDDMLAVDAALANALDESGRETAYRTMWIPIDLNTASREEILLIPGVGERMAHEFEEYRPYEAMAEFRREIGKYVDDAEVERLAMYVTLE